MAVQLSNTLYSILLDGLTSKTQHPQMYTTEGLLKFVRVLEEEVLYNVDPGSNIATRATYLLEQFNRELEKRGVHTN